MPCKELLKLRTDAFCVEIAGDEELLDPGLMLARHFDVAYHLFKVVKEASSVSRGETSLKKDSRLSIASVSPGKQQRGTSASHPWRSAPADREAEIQCRACLSPYCCSERGTDTRIELLWKHLGRQQTYIGLFGTDDFRVFSR